MSKVPNPIYWGFNEEVLKNKSYLKHIEFLKQNTECDIVFLSFGKGVQLDNVEQVHEPLRELVEKAHALGLKVGIREPNVAGFFNAAVDSVGHEPALDQVQLFPIDNPYDATALVIDGEVAADAEGKAEYTHIPRWARNKIMPICNKLLRVYAFDKTGEGFYKPGSLVDVTKKAQVVGSFTNQMDLEIDAGVEFAGKTFFIMVAQFYNYRELYGDAQLRYIKRIMDAYSDIPLDGILMDEYGYMKLDVSGVNKGKEPPFRGRHYSVPMEKYYEDTLHIDLRRLLFDMRYAPEDDEGVRIRAINIYFDDLRKPPIRHDHDIQNYAHKLFGDGIYEGAHNTFHNWLDNDEIWSTGCGWWDLKRRYGHTDENIAFPVRMGIMLAAEEPLMIDMYYSKKAEDYYHHIVEGAPFGTREFHHSYRDFTWGMSFTEPEFLRNINRLDRLVARLNDFETEYPRLDLLIIFGAAAQNNWYPDKEARNKWDVDGKVQPQQKSDMIWKSGYRCALVPDYAIEDGRITLSNGKLAFKGHTFDHCLFLYPKYAKRSTYDFLNAAGAAGASIAAVGRADIDFDAHSAKLDIPCYDEFSLSILEDMGCPKGALDGGCIYTDGSFALTDTDALIDGIPKQFDFMLDGVHYTGTHTGLLAYRKDKCILATVGSSLFIDGAAAKIEPLNID